jgi:hypothetical protein
LTKICIAKVAHGNEKVADPCFIALLERRCLPVVFAVIGIVYLYMLQGWLMPQLQEDIPDLIYQQAGTPTHFHIEVRSYLDELHPNQGIGLGGLVE